MDDYEFYGRDVSTLKSLGTEAKQIYLNVLQVCLRGIGTNYIKADILFVVAFINSSLYLSSIQCL